MLQKPAKTAVSIHPLLAERWSPRAFSGQPIDDETLLRLLEAARWAPSSNNSQPWRFLVAKREDEAAFATMFDCLMRGNQHWAGGAAALIVVTAVVRDEAEGELNPVHYYNAGLAVAQMVVEASANGFVAHQMGGIHKDKIREVYALPPEVDPIVAVAIGTIGDPEALEASLREREYAERVRKPLGEVVFNGRWGHSYPLEEA